MLVETPATGAFGAAVIAGTPGGPGPSAARFGVVMKAAYDLVPGGSGGSAPRTMVQVEDPDRAAIVFADAGVMTFVSQPPAPAISATVTPADFTVKPWPTASDPDGQVLAVAGHEFAVPEIAASDHQQLSFDVTYEADVALAKNRTDIVVTGFVTATDAGAVVVNGAPWLRRTPPPTGDADSARNLFGFQPRTAAPRDSAVGDSRDFANYHRRGDGFSAPGNGPPLPAGALVEIYQDSDISGAADYAFRLPDLSHGARLRVYCGHGPDVAPHWRIVPLADPRPDTLIVHPATHRAEILWRTDFAADLAPADTYRKIQIRQGGF